MQYRHLRMIGGKGTASGQFTDSINGIALDQAGLVYAVGDSQVKVFRATGDLVRKWKTERPGYCVTVHNDVVYVGESEQIEKFSLDGSRIAVWQDADRLSVVTSIGFVGEFVLVGDANDRCIRRFDKDGKWLGDIGKDNNTKGFLIPNGYMDFSVDSEGVIHAVNSAKHRVERYSVEGKLLGYWGKFGTRRPENFPGCCNPTNIALTATGQIVVTEKADPRLKLYDAEGNLLALVGSEAFDSQCKNMAVATDSENRAYVVDTARLEIHVFELEGVLEEAADESASVVGAGERKP